MIQEEENASRCFLQAADEKPPVFGIYEEYKLAEEMVFCETLRQKHPYEDVRCLGRSVFWSVQSHDENTTSIYIRVQIEARRVENQLDKILGSFTTSLFHNNMVTLLIFK